MITSASATHIPEAGRDDQADPARARAKELVAPTRARKHPRPRQPVARSPPIGSDPRPRPRWRIPTGIAQHLPARSAGRWPYRDARVRHRASAGVTVVQEPDGCAAQHHRIDALFPERGKRPAGAAQQELVARTTPRRYTPFSRPRHGLRRPLRLRVRDRGAAAGHASVRRERRRPPHDMPAATPRPPPRRRRERRSQEEFLLLVRLPAEGGQGTRPRGYGGRHHRLNRGGGLHVCAPRRPGTRREPLRSGGNSSSR